jgi:hypothetical protein
VSHQTLAGKIDTLAVIVEYPANDLSALEPKWTRLLNQLGPLLQLDLVVCEEFKSHGMGWMIGFA